MALRPPLRQQFRLSELFSDTSDTSDQVTFEPNFLRSKARWIRDDLDPEIAREGPSILSADQVVVLVKFLEQLPIAAISIADIAWSRIHYAVLCIAGRATRWPGALVEEADKVIMHWTLRYGPLEDLRAPLHEEGGRLYGVCAATDLSKEVLEIKWLRARDSRTLTGYARRHGDLGFKPGE